MLVPIPHLHRHVLLFPQSGLSELADTIVGGVTGPGLSGGQVRLAHPLLIPVSVSTGESTPPAFIAVHIHLKLDSIPYHMYMLLSIHVIK